MGRRSGIWPWLVWSPCLAGKRYISKAVLNSIRKLIKKKKKHLVWEETVPPKWISVCLSSVQLDPESRQDLACGGDQHLGASGKAKDDEKSQRTSS